MRVVLGIITGLALLYITVWLFSTLAQLEEAITPIEIANYWVLYAISMILMTLTVAVPAIIISPIKKEKD